MDLKRSQDRERKSNFLTNFRSINIEEVKQQKYRCDGGVWRMVHKKIFEQLFYLEINPNWWYLIQ